MYITHAACLSPQPTLDGRFTQTKETALYEGTKYYALEPSYKAILPLRLLRQMSKAMRLTAGTGLPLIHAQHRTLEGIILGMSPMSIDQSVHFIEQLKLYTKGWLSSQAFAETMAHLIAGALTILGQLGGACQTHINEGLAFEQALLDALIRLEQGSAARLLVGGVEVLSEITYAMHTTQGRVKSLPTTSKNLLQVGGLGTAWGEGATLFVAEAVASKQAKARIVDVHTCCFGSPEQMANELRGLLQCHHWAPEQVQGLVLGYNGDASTDVYYKTIEEQLFPKAGVWVYKHLMGDSTVANAQGCWLGLHLLQGNDLPKATVWRKPIHLPSRIIVYNQYAGTQHGIILMEAAGE